MNRAKKLGTCVAAAFTILAGATYLSTPVEAAEGAMGCGVADVIENLAFGIEACRGFGRTFQLDSMVCEDGDLSMHGHCV